MNRPLGGRLRVVLATYALSCVGTGLVYPFTAVYLVTVRHLGSGAAGLFFGLVAAVSFATAPAAGRLVDAWSPRGMCATGVLCQATGYALLGTAASVPAVVGCAALVGLGNGMFYPAFTPVMAALLDPDQRKRGFSYRYLAMNLGLGVGAAVAGRLLAWMGTVHAYHLLYLLDGASFLPLAMALALLGPAARRAAEPAGPTAGHRSYRSLLRNRPLRVLLITQTMLVLFGYSQLDTAVPLLLTKGLGVAATTVGMMIAVNTVAVVLLQVPLGRLLERPAGAVVLAWCAVVWAAAAAVGASLTLASGGWRTALLMAYAVVFAIGETCYAVAYQPLLTEVTPPGLLGRASALSSLSWNTGAAAGPALGLLVVGAVAPGLYWVGYGGALVVTAVLAFSLRSRAPGPPGGDPAAAAGTAGAAVGRARRAQRRTTATAPGEGD